MRLALSTVLLLGGCQALWTTVEKTGEFTLDKLSTALGAIVGWLLTGDWVGVLTGAVFGDTASDAVAAKARVDALEEEVRELRGLLAQQEANAADAWIATAETLGGAVPWAAGGLVVLILGAWLLRSPLQKKCDDD